eukprot:347878-Chlamydomonas_euryale.AAC.1
MTAGQASSAVQFTAVGSKQRRTARSMTRPAQCVRACPGMQNTKVAVSRSTRCSLAPAPPPSSPPPLQPCVRACPGMQNIKVAMWPCTATHTLSW